MDVMKQAWKGRMFGKPSICLDGMVWYGMVCVYVYEYVDVCAVARWWGGERTGLGQEQEWGEFKKRAGARSNLKFKLRRTPYCTRPPSGLLFVFAFILAGDGQLDWCAILHTRAIHLVSCQS